MQQQIQINPADTLECKCQKCNNITFSEVLLIRKVPKFLIGALTDQFMPMPVFQCTKCGEVHADSLAPQIRNILFSTVEDVQEVQEPTKPTAKIIQLS